MEDCKANKNNSGDKDNKDKNIDDGNKVNKKDEKDLKTKSKNKIINPICEKRKLIKKELCNYLIYHGRNIPMEERG